MVVMVELSLSKVIFTKDAKEILAKLLINDANRTFKYISNRDFIQKIYSRVEYMPLWFSENGLKRKEVNELFSVIEDDLILDRRGNIYKIKVSKKSLNRDGI